MFQMIKLHTNIQQAYDRKLPAFEMIYYFKNLVNYMA